MPTTHRRYPVCVATGDRTRTRNKGQGPREAETLRHKKRTDVTYFYTHPGLSTCVGGLAQGSTLRVSRVPRCTPVQGEVGEGQTRGSRHITQGPDVDATLTCPKADVYLLDYLGTPGLDETHDPDPDPQPLGRGERL